MMGAATLTWQLLTKVFENRKVEPFFLTKALGANKIYSPTTKVTVRTVTHGGGKAAIGLRGDPATRINAGITVTEVDRTPPQIYEMDNVADAHLTTNYDPNTMQMLEGNSDILRSMNYIYGKKADEMMLRYRRALEWMMREVGFTGKVTDDDRGIEIDFEIDDAADYTLNSTADPLSDLGAICEAYATTNGIFPDLIVTTPAIAKAILAHSKVEKWINKNTYSFGNLQSQFNDPMTRFMGSFKEFGIPEIYAYVGSYADSTGAAQTFVPSGKLMVTNRSKWSVGYAAQVDYDINADGAPIMGEFLAKEKIAADGKSKDLMLSSFPLPMIESGDAVKVLDVTIS
jgi:hypothetical protein